MGSHECHGPGSERPVTDNKGGDHMFKKLAIVTTLTLAAFSLQAAGAAARSRAAAARSASRALWPQSFVSNDSHVSNQIQDEIYGYALHRTLYNWDSDRQQAGAGTGHERDASPHDGLTYTFKLREDAFFHNGRKMTADDIIWYLHPHHGPREELSGGAAYVSRIKGADRLSTKARPRRSPASRRSTISRSRSR